MRDICCKINLNNKSRYLPKETINIKAKPFFHFDIVITIELLNDKVLLSTVPVLHGVGIRMAG